MNCYRQIKDFLFRKVLSVVKYSAEFGVEVGGWRATVHRHLFLRDQPLLYSHVVSYSPVMSYIHIYSPMMSYLHAYSPVMSYIHVYPPVMSYIHVYSHVMAYIHVYSL